MKEEVEWGATHKETIDWASGSVYVQDGSIEERVGKYDRVRGWQWKHVALIRL